VIVREAAADKEAVGFAVDAAELGGESFGAAVGALRVEGSRFGLRDFAWAAEYLG
jgi:hypothetical protein